MSWGRVRLTGEGKGERGWAERARVREREGERAGEGGECSDRGGLCLCLLSSYPDARARGGRACRGQQPARGTRTDGTRPRRKPKMTLFGILSKLFPDRSPCLLPVRPIWGCCAPVLAEGNASCPSFFFSPTIRVYALDAIKGRSDEMEMILVPHCYSENQKRDIWDDDWLLSLSFCLLSASFEANCY